MKRILAILALSLALAVPVFAQTMTPEATPIVASGGDTITIEQSPTVPVESTTPLFDIGKAVPYVAVIILLLVLIIIEVVDKRRLSELVAKSITPEMFAVFSAAINRGILDAGTYVQGTITPLDDALYAPAKTQIDDLLARIKVLEDAKSTPTDSAPRASGSG